MMESSEEIINRKAKSLLEAVDVNIAETERRTGTSVTKMQETYTVYLIETRARDAWKNNLPEIPDVTLNKGPYSLWRRYSEFEMLRNYLGVIYPHVVLPPIPEKRTSYTWQKLATDNLDPDFIERRRAGLETFLQRCASHPQLGFDTIFVKFLQHDDGWKEALQSSDYLSKADSKFKTLTSRFRVKAPNKYFDEVRTYSNDLQSHISTLLKSRASMCDHVYGLHKLHSNYGRVLSEWAASGDKEMADSLQTAGHYMDVFSSSVESMLEEEEMIAEQLKEYLVFCEALRHVCKKQECLQLDQEKAEEYLQAKRKEKEAVSSAKSGWSLGGMKSRLLGSGGGDSAEQRQQKLQQLEEEIREAEEKCRTSQTAHTEFVEAAEEDIERFHRQKSKDIRELLVQYAVLQIKACKKNIAVWQSTRDAYSKS